MKELRREGGIIFHKVEDASEVNKFQIESYKDPSLGGFNFFIGMGIVDYPKTFKMWLREFPRPIFIAVSKNMKLLGWVYIQDWGEMTREGDPIYVLSYLFVGGAPPRPPFRHGRPSLRWGSSG